MLPQSRHLHLAEKLIDLGKQPISLKAYRLSIKDLQPAPPTTNQNLDSENSLDVAGL